MVTVVLDDNDAHIKYSGTWFKAGGPGEYGSTTHGTRAGGAKATFIFSGSSVAVYGTIPSNDAYKDPPVSSYSIDGTGAVTFSATQGTAPKYQQQYFQSPRLADGEHTLVITSTLNNTAFWIDYIEFTPTVKQPSQKDLATAIVTKDPMVTTIQRPPNTPSTMSCTITSTNSPIPSPMLDLDITGVPANSSTNIIVNTKQNEGSKTNQLFGASETLSGTAVPTVATGSLSVPTGVIVGATVGEVVVLLVLCFFLWRCRRKKWTAIDRPSTFWSWSCTGLHTTEVTPFEVPSPSNPAPGGCADVLSIRPTDGTDSTPWGYGHGYTTGGTSTPEKFSLGLRPSQSNEYPIGLINAQRNHSRASSEIPSRCGSVMADMASSADRKDKHAAPHAVVGPFKLTASPSFASIVYDTFASTASPSLQSYAEAGPFYQRDSGDPPAYQCASMHHGTDNNV